MPKHGILFYSGGIEQTEASFITVDWERQEVAKYETDDVTTPSGVKKTELRSVKTVRLTPAERHRLVELSDEVWGYRYPTGNEEVRVTVTQRCTDVVWDLYLIDGEVMRREGGPCFPQGRELALENAVEEVLNAKSAP